MQIQIIYSDAGAQSAKTIQQDLSETTLRLDHNITVIVLTPDILGDASIQADIQAQPAGTLLVPVMVQKTTVPDSLKGHDVLDLTKKYDKSKLVNFIKRADLTKERLAKNRRLLFVVGGVALLMFVISLASISAGVVAFPVDEYATENAIRDSQIATIVAPQIEELRPRTTEDALNFEATLESVRNDDLVPFIAGTATAIPLQLQATNEARETQIIETEIALTQSASD